MKAEKHLEQSVKALKNSPFPFGPDDRTKADTLTVLAKASGQTLKIVQKKQTIMERIKCMKPYVKLAAAAVIMIGVAGLFIGLFHSGASPAWAIENTIAALENIQSLMMAGTIIPPDINEAVDFIAWATPNADGNQSERVRIEWAGRILIDEPNVSYDYRVSENIVYIKGPSSFSLNPWPGSRFFEIMKQWSKNWQITHGKDSDTGRKCVFVTCSGKTSRGESRSWWFEFDMETYLPIKLKQWTNSQWEGEPQINVTQLVYNSQLPDGIFDFKIPHGVKVVKDNEEKNPIMRLINDPNHGMSVDNMTKEKASTEIAKKYFEAVIKQDWEQVNKLRVGASVEQWRQIYTIKSPVKEIVEIKPPYEQEGCSVGLLTPVVIKFENGRVVETKLIVAFREADLTRWCVIIGTWGQDNSL